MKLYTLFALPVLALIAMGQTSCDEQTRALLASTCPALDQVWLHYDAVANEGALSQNTINKVAFARQQSDRMCANPAGATTVSVTAAAAAVYLATSQAFKEGGVLTSANARVGYAKLNNLRAIVEKAQRSAR